MKGKSADNNSKVRTKKDRSTRWRSGNHANRRSFLKATGAAGVVGITGLAGCSGAGKGGGPIKFGSIHLLSGFASVYGKSAQMGYQLAKEEINANGGINGRQIGDILYRDSEASPSTAVQHARSLVNSENVDLLMGLDSSGVALQVVPIMKQLKKPFMITHAATPFVTNPGEGERAKGNKYVFRDGVNLAQNLYGAAKTAGKTDASSWTTIGPNYAFGTQTWEYFKAYTKAMGLNYDYLEDATAYPQLGASDYKAHINKVIQADPDGVVTSLWGGDLITFLQQAKNTDFFKVVDELLMTVGAATDVLRPMGNNMPTGLWAGTRYWFLEPEIKANKQFRKKFMEKHPGRPPSYNAQDAYTALYLYKSAIEKAGSTETGAVIDALEGIEITAPVDSNLKINPKSHQAVLPAVWGKTARSQEWDVAVLDPVNRLPAPASKLRDLLSGSSWPAGV